MVAHSGDLVIGNSEILSWLLAPRGILTLVLVGALTLLMELIGVRVDFVAG